MQKCLTLRVVMINIETIVAGAGFRGCTEARRLAVAGARCWRSGFSQIGL